MATDQVPAQSHHSLLLPHSTKSQLSSSSPSSQEMAPDQVPAQSLHSLLLPHSTKSQLSSSSPSSQEMAPDQVPAQSLHSLLLPHSTKSQLCSSSTTSQEMAPNRQPQRRDPSSSSSHEDAPSKEEAEVSKDDQISTPKPAAQNQLQIPKIKPSSKLVEKDPPSKSAATKHGSHMAKRKASNIEVETAKEKKDVKKRRLFTEGDDIVILERMIEYRSKTGLEPRSNIKGFLEFVNKSLSFAGATPKQVYEKVRRLQESYEEKYEKNVRGENHRVFVKPHEEKVFELSKKIWENNMGGNGLGNENVWKMSVGFRKEGQKRMGVDMGSVKIVKDGLEVISESKKLELEGKWEQLMVDEIEHYLKKLDLIREQMIMVVEGMKLYGS